MHDSPSTSRRNYLHQFRDSHSRQWKQLSAHQFMTVWRHYDTDSNGYIDGKELDAFLREFVLSVVPADVISDEVISPAGLEQMKLEVMAAYDENGDNRIDIGELAQMLPMEENFLLLFRRQTPVQSSVEFMKIWRKFDINSSGFIERLELRAFLTCLLTDNGRIDTVSEASLDEYEQTILTLFDFNQDGRLQLSEMSRLLPVKENHLRRPLFTNSSRLSGYEIDRIFRKYDVDKNGLIEMEELDGLLKDLLDLTEEVYGEDTLDGMRKSILDICDENHDGKISRDELMILLLQQKQAFAAGNLP